MITTQYFFRNAISALQQGKQKSVAKKILLLAVGCTLLNLAQSQADKRLLLADQYFAAGEYYTAAGLYGQFLNPIAQQKLPTNFPLNSKKNATGKTGAYSNRLAILYKQAEAYRLANYWLEAARLYEQCFEKDSVNYEAALYWYTVCQRSLGNYTVAEESLNRLLARGIKDDFYQQKAADEKNILQFVKSQIRRPDSVLYQVKKVEASTGTERGVFGLTNIGDKQFILTSTQTDSVTSPGENPNHNRLFCSVLIGERLQNIEPIMIEGMDASLNQGAASLSANGKHLYFTQWKKENGQTVASIYYATKRDIGWSQPVALASVNQQGYSSKQPFCSADGRYLFFASDREGGMGKFDVWYAAIKEDGTTSEPINAGPAINTNDNEQAPFYHAVSTALVFASDRAPGMGGYDLYSSKGSNDKVWKEVENLGYPVNSSRDDIYFYAAPEGDMLSNVLVGSDRGSECCLASYTISKAAKKKMISGEVRDCNDDSPVENAQVDLKDASGKTVSTITKPDGKYIFELDKEVAGQLFVHKEKYTDKASDLVVESRNEKDWLVDTLYTAALCIEKKLVIKVENVVSVYFDFDQSKLKERGVAQLDSIYNVLMQNPTATIQISGYTDGRGSVEYNKKLSDKRAKSCADYLIEKGIDSARISFESFGACCPVEMEMINGRDNPDGRSMNRRALININKD